MEVTMQRESEIIETIVQDPTWKRVDRLLPEAASADPRAATAFLLGLAAVLAVHAALQ
jgi:hypothetical protein